MAKRILKGLARRFPWARALIARIPLLPTLLGTVGILSASQVARLRQGYFGGVSIRGFPKGIRFQPVELTPGLALLFGATHYHPVFSQSEVQLVFRDADGRRIATPPRKPLAACSVEPPRVVARSCPAGVVWYRLLVDEPSAAWDTLELWFQYPSGPNGNSELPSGFEFYAVAVKCEESRESTDWLVDFVTGAPVWSRAVGE